MSKKVAPPIARPTDFDRRRQLVEQMIEGKQITSPIGIDPHSYSPEALAAILAPASAFDQAPGVLVKVHMALDVPEMKDDLLRQLFIPAAASAPSVTMTQADALSVAGHDLTKNLPLSPAQARTLAEKHDVYLSAASGVKTLLRGIERGRAACCAVRLDYQDKARAWVTSRIDSLPDGSPRKTELRSRLSTIDAIAQTDKGRVETLQAEARRDREEVLGQLDAAQADLDLANVLRDIRAERTPEYDTLLQAARHLKQQRAASTATPPTPPTTRPKSGARRQQAR